LLSEILEEYKESNEEQKAKLIKEFTNMIWKSKYSFKTYKKYYTYKVNEELLNGRNDLIEMFSKYQIIEFTFCKSFHGTKLNSIDYIRIHINNMFGYLVDKNVYLSREYYHLLLVPKNEYFKTIEKLKNGENVNCEEIENRIIQSLQESEIIKEKSLEKKLNMKWSDYKKLINTYIERMFNNYIPPHEYEEKHGWEMHVNVDGWNENNYIIKYFCKSLTGYLRNYVKSINRKDKQCEICNITLIGITKKRYCEKCAIKRKKESNKQADKKYKRKKREKITYLSV
jgi:hypothetical protein